MSEENEMKDKICMITGATGGIGLETAGSLAGKGGTLVLVGRDEEKTQAVVAQLKQKTGNDALEYLIGDLSEMSDVRRIAEEFDQSYPRLDVLVNNAGAIFGERKETSDGFERTIALNHYSWFLLTHLLLDKIKASRSARIVNVASAAHKFGKLDFDNLNGEQAYSPGKIYGQSKSAMIMTTYELARRLEHTSITANCLHPGVIATNFGAGTKKPFLLTLIDTITRAEVSVEEGAATQIYLASSPEVEGVTGEYFVKCKPAKSAKETYDRVKAVKLWDITSNKVGLTKTY